MKNKLSAIFYLGLGFFVGYLFDTLRRNGQTHEDASFAADRLETLQDATDAFVSREPIEQKAGQKEKEESSADFLQAINGIGPAYAKRIFAGGVRSFSQLGRMSAEELATISQARSQDQVEGWLAQANEFVNK